MHQSLHEHPPRYVAYADETRYNVGRYRGIALVSLREVHAAEFKTTIRQLLNESSVSELKWQKVNSAKDRFACLKVLDYAVKKACLGHIRADVLVWDVLDKRHVVNRRDDIANLQRMYYHLMKNVLRDRWPDGATWNIFPDENTSLDWESIENHLLEVSTEFETVPELLKGSGFGLRLRKEFNIEELRSTKSCEEPLVQTADIFAGLAAFSYEKYDAYDRWSKENTPQGLLYTTSDQAPAKISGVDKERFRVLEEFNRMCKRTKLGVSLQTCRSLWTPNPKNPLNFWLYVPQHSKDRAPVKAD